ncbi:MAG: hypothetical protein GF317_02620 [Candidatus Lokiarchaeota archaeon]|nr:hypothetical protein [Candidatus Lokiarchaeota archaeon]MBD3198800.1 hypothetical protein [Candidatus Lokiarchaeota archaeon]
MLRNIARGVPNRQSSNLDLARYLIFLKADKITAQVIVTLFPLTSFIFPPLIGNLSDKD